MALGGNRNTAYSHALFTYNQRVKCIGDRCSNKNRKTFSYKNHKGRSKPLFALPFACIDNCAEIMNFIMRTHPLHFTTSSTSLSWHIRLRWLKESNAVAEGDECDGWRSRMQWPKETNAIAEGVECGGWRSRMRWPKESNAVAGGDTFWTLITRDCCIILNWVHLKKSRIIFFVIVTYWQSMARFRKNDFFKWAQKIKSVFCFIPHTHEGCDVKTQLWALSKLTFQSTHPRRVWHRFGFGGVHDDWFQSTHPRRVWLDFITLNVNKPKFQSTHPRRVWPVTLQLFDNCLVVSIHTPTKGVT